MLSACGSLNERLSGAAAKKAVAESGTTLPDLPTKCSAKMRRINPQEGDQWFAVQVRWLTAADEQDERTALCARFYQNVKTQFGASHP